MKIRINNLKPHPKHSEIYQTPKDIRSEWKDLFTSIEENGMMQPIIISQDNTIISGHRRWMVAKNLSWNEVKVEKINVDEEKFNSMLVQLNTNREKTLAEKINEVLFLLKVIPKRQGQTLSEDEKGGRLTIIAKKLGKGFSRENISKIEKIEKADINKVGGNTSLIELLKNGGSIDSVFLMIGGHKNEKDDIEKIITEDGKYKLINGDSKLELDKIERNSIDMCFTSFPYWRQRNYEVGENENVNWGEEDNLEDYLKTSTEISRKIYDTIKETGSFYLNMGDTIRNQQYMFIPEQLCMRIMSLGFKLLNKIIWKKKNSKPLNLDKQLQPSYEHVFHFVKDVEKFKNRVLRFKTGDKFKVSGSVGDRRKQSNREKKKKIIISPYSRFRTFYDENEGYSDIIISAAARSQVTKKITRGDHPAVFDETLPLFAILQSTEVGDKVRDCCSGSGTVGVCTLFGREYIGIEVSKQYHKYGNRRLKYFNSIFDENEMKEFERMAA